MAEAEELRRINQEMNAGRRGDDAAARAVNESWAPDQPVLVGLDVEPQRGQRVAMAVAGQGGAEGRAGTIAAVHHAGEAVDVEWDREGDGPGGESAQLVSTGRDGRYELELVGDTPTHDV